jgi:glycerophosphoryl diester phosphodiesterase
MISHVQWIAHRGSSYRAPENTLASFRLGWEETSVCELDVHADHEGRLVVIHDDTTLRTTGIDCTVSASSLAELQRLDAGSFKGERWMGEKIPSLEEVLAVMPEGKSLLIEIKSQVDLVPELARIIAASGKSDRLALQSFYPEICGAAKKAVPGVPIYLLGACKQDPQTGVWSPTVDTAISYATQLGLAGLGINDTPLVDADSVAKIHAAGLRLNLWTIDEVEAARRLIALGVDGIITNRPGWLKLQFAQG